MFKYLSIALLFAVLIFPSDLTFRGQVYAQEDAVEDEIQEDEVVDDEDSKVETEEEASEEETTSPTGKDTEEEEEKSDDDGVGPSPYVETAVLFPDYPDKQLPAGKPLYVLVGFHNKHPDRDFIVETLDASFRYPQDYSYHIQNFTAIQYNRLVKSGQEASFQYAFHPHESYGGRPFGLTVMMFYKDEIGEQYAAGVFNETVTFQEIEESFDGETFFLYVLLAATALLVIFGINYAFTHKFKKSSQGKNQPEVGTQGDKNNVDYDWLPRETTDFKPSPQRSPRQRRVKRSSGNSGEE